jgi:hypothetical protein
MNLDRRRFLQVAALGASAGATARWGTSDLIATEARNPGIRRHEVYQPEIQRGYVVESTLDGLPYNHCPTVMWFKDRWFCAWNGNDIPVEGEAGLQIQMSTSVDGRNWSVPVAPFSSPEHCHTPYRVPEARQWQPVSIIVGEELWCFYWQSGEELGLLSDRLDMMFGRLKDPDGKWEVNRLDLGDAGGIRMFGTTWTLFTAQNPVQLRSGRVLLPVLLMEEKRASDAPEKARGWWGFTKRATVFYTDDGGVTWQISSGCTPHDRTWLPWEPTVWEQSDGSVAMFFRNNSHPSHVETMPRPSEFLLGSMSIDGGATWAEPRHIPIETVCSRMYVMPVDGEGISRPIRPETDHSQRLWLMLHNDFPGRLSWTENRRDLALFFKRGDGFEFTAGPVFSGWEPAVCYPQGVVHDGALMIVYTESFIEKRSIRYAYVSPLPDPGKRYLLPRADVLRTPRPRREGATLHFGGAQHLDARGILAPGGDGLALAAWIRPDSHGVLLDNRKPRDTSGAAGGFCWGGRTIGSERMPVMYVQIGGHSLAAPLRIRQGEWMYAGVDLDLERGQIHFIVDGRSLEIALPRDVSRALAGTSARIGAAKSTGTPIISTVRFLGCFDAPIGMSAHHRLHDDFAREFSRPTLGGGTAPAAKRLLWLDPAAPEFASGFILPDARFQGVRIGSEDGRQILRFTGEGSAGVDLDPNNRRRGDVVELRFRFKPRSGGRLILCTVGDANQPARVQWEREIIRLVTAEMTVDVGRAPAGTWSEVAIRTAAGYTEASVNDGSIGRVDHQPEGTWIYLGQGYRTGRGSVEDTFVVDVGSVESQVRVAEFKTMPSANRR